MDCCPHETNPSTSRAAWICPMCPSVGSDAPGSCPHCGMALEARVPKPDEDNPELQDMLRRLWFALACTLPLLAISLGGLLDGPIGNWSQAALASLVVLSSGRPFLQRGLESLRSGRLNMFTLILMGVGVAYLSSLLILIFGDEVQQLHFQAACMIVSLVLLGQVLELAARQRSGKAISSLLNLSPKRAIRVSEGGIEEEVSIDKILTGETLRIRPGERVPVDGRVLEGRSEVDESMVSGEAMPVTKLIGSNLIGGTLNGRGSMLMIAEHSAADGLLARMVAQVAKAQRSRAPVQALVDRVSAVFVPLVLIVALASFLTQFLADDGQLSRAIMRATAVLVVACPCALGLATPMSIMVSMGKGARLGILFRNAEAIQALRSVDTLLLDKTGTITVGYPEITAIHSTSELSEDELLRIAASLERGSEHPIAKAIDRAAKAKALSLQESDEFTAIPGKGVTGQVAGQRIHLGNEALLSDHDIDCSQLADETSRSRQAGNIVMLMAVEGDCVGLFALGDPIKPNSKHALEDLRKDGLHLAMLSGDHQSTANSVARSLGISQVHAGVLPEDKGIVVSDLQNRGHKVAMSGDGINDATALAQADVGIAMGTGSDVAIESASVTLVTGELRGICEARRLSKGTLNNIRQNLFLAFAYNLFAIPLAAGFLEGWVAYTPPPSVAAAAMSASSLVVVLNALRIR